MTTPNHNSGSVLRLFHFPHHCPSPLSLSLDVTLDADRRRCAEKYGGPGREEAGYVRPKEEAVARYLRHQKEAVMVILTVTGWK